MRAGHHSMLSCNTLVQCTPVILVYLAVLCALVILSKRQIYSMRYYNTRPPGTYRRDRVPSCDGRQRKQLKYTVYQRFLKSTNSEEDFMSKMREILKWDERGHDRTALGREVRAHALKPAFDSSQSYFLPGPARCNVHTGSTVFVHVCRMHCMV